MPHQSTNDVRKLREAWRAAGLEGPLADRLDEFDTRRRELAADFRATTAGADTTAASVATGDLSMPAGMIEHRRSPLTEEGRARAQALHSKAQDVLLRRLYSELRAVGDGFITDHLAPAHAAVIDEATKLAPIVADVHDDATAIRSHAKVREAWAKVTALGERRRLLLQARQALRFVVTPIPKDALPLASSFADPDRRPAALGTVHPARQLLTLIESGSGPGIYTAAQVAERMAPAKPGQAKAGRKWADAKDLRRDGADVGGDELVPVA